MGVRKWPFLWKSLACPTSINTNASLILIKHEKQCAAFECFRMGPYYYFWQWLFAKQIIGISESRIHPKKNPTIALANGYFHYYQMKQLFTSPKSPEVYFGWIFTIFHDNYRFLVQRRTQNSTNLFRLSNTFACCILYVSLRYN